MDSQETLEILEKVGAIIHGHFIYTSGKHGATYINKDVLYAHTEETRLLCLAIAEHFAQDDSCWIDAIVAPAMGGIILSQWTAFALQKLTKREVFALYAEKETVVIPNSERNSEFASRREGVLSVGEFADRILNKQKIIMTQGRLCYVETGRFVFRHGYDKIIAGKNVLVVEDVLTTGVSAKKVIEVTRALGGNVMGLGVLCNRGGVMPKDVMYPPRLFSLANIMLDAWDEADCLLCVRNVPINTDAG